MNISENAINLCAYIDGGGGQQTRLNDAGAHPTVHHNKQKNNHPHFL